MEHLRTTASDGSEGDNSEKMISYDEGIEVFVRLCSSEAVAQRCSVKKGVFTNFTKFTSSGLWPATLLKKETLAQVFFL